MSAKFKSIETKYMETREATLRALAKLDRRDFLRVSTAVLGATLARGIVHPRSFSTIDIAHAQEGEKAPFRVAYISDSHLYEKELNERFVNALMRAVDDVNALDPQP